MKFDTAMGVLPTKQWNVSANTPLIWYNERVKDVMRSFRDQQAFNTFNTLKLIFTDLEQVHALFARGPTILFNTFSMAC